MTKNQIIALGVFAVIALTVLAFIPPPARMLEEQGDQKVVLGTFRGTTICADCPGIDTTLTLTQDTSYSAEGTYELSMVYLGKDVEPYVSSGVWTTERGTPADPDATVYALYEGDSDEAQRFLRVDVDTIRMLDGEGNVLPETLPSTLVRTGGEPPAPLPERMTFTGTKVCLPHRDATGPQTLECAAGVRSADGTHYVLDSAGLDETSRMLLESGATVSITGTVTPIELLSTDQWAKYDVAGVVSVESVKAI